MTGKVIRKAERRIIADAVNYAAEGRGLVVSISGETGVGKTYLAAEGLRLAGRRGFRMLRGISTRYHEDVSFAPLVQALSPLVDPAEKSGAAITSGLTDLAQLFSWLNVPYPAPIRDRGAERTRLFEAVRALVQRAAVERPVAILVDDLHWADPASLDLLAYLALSLGDCPCLFIVTDRGDPVEPVRRFRAALHRADRVIDVRLGPLNPDEAAELVAHELAGEPPQPLLDLLERRAGGIPLYLTSLIGSLRGRGRLFRSGDRWVLDANGETVFPEGLVDVIADRLDELDPVDVAILTALGMWGDRATMDMIGVLVPDSPTLGPHLDRLVDAGLVDERVGDPVTYQGHHPLVIEAACARLSARERRLQHGAAAHFLLDRAAAPGPTDRMIAHHVRLAGPAFDRDQALVILTSAVAGNADRGDYEALPLAEAAALLIRECGRTELLPTALERVAESAAWTGDGVRAMDAWRDAAAAHGTNHAAAARCRYRLAQLQVEQGDPQAANRSVEEALADLDDPELGPERFRVLQLRATFSVRASDWTQLRRDVSEIRFAAGQLGIGWAADFFDRYVNAGPDRLLLPPSARDIVAVAGQVAASSSEEMAAAFEPLHRPWILDAINRGDLTEAARRARLVPGHYVVSPGAAAAAIALEGFSEWLAGRWDRALPLSVEALVIAHRHASHRFIALALMVRGLIIAHRGELDRADDCIADARAVFSHGDAHVISTIDTVAAQVALLHGRPASALAILDGTGPVNYFGLLIFNLRAAAAAAAGDRDRLDRIADEVAQVEGPWSAAITRRVDGLNHQDPDELAEAAGRLSDLGMPYESALVQLEAAEMQPAGAGSVERATAALAIFDLLGAAPAGDRARRVLRRLGQRPPPGPRTGGPLSGRETQVAGLVVQGLSNADVAARLFISHRTVTTHLERIYRRLGISSRAELARFVGNESERNT